MSRLPAKEISVSTVSVDRQQFGPWQVLLRSGLPDGCAAVRQVHGGSIVPAHSALPEMPADGVFVGDTSAAAVATADCMPLVMVSATAAVVLHVSRKTLIHGLLENAFSYIPPREIDHIFAGPHICEYHFSFEREGAELKRFREVYPRAVHFHGGRLHVSLRASLEHVLQERGIHPQRVVFDGRCTYEQLTLPSYRRWQDTGKSGELEHLWTVVKRYDHTSG